MASEVSICNRALQKLGASRITSLTEDSPNARSCNNAYETVRDAELAAHPWSFARRRTSLAADSDTPEFGYEYQYTLPADYLRLLPSNDSHVDWQIESKSDGSLVILTDYGAPLEIIYIARVEDPNLFHATFIESLACRLALEMCEEITQSNQKAEKMERQYTLAIREARRANAFERISDELPEDDWLAARR
jgi:hypothetical protein